MLVKIPDGKKLVVLSAVPSSTLVHGVLWPLSQTPEMEYLMAHGNGSIHRFAPRDLPAPIVNSEKVAEMMRSGDPVLFIELVGNITYFVRLSEIMAAFERSKYVLIAGTSFALQAHGVFSGNVIRICVRQTQDRSAEAFSWHYYEDPIMTGSCVDPAVIRLPGAFDHILDLSVDYLDDFLSRIVEMIKG